MVAEGNKKTTSLKLRINPDDLTAIDIVAKNYGLKRSAFCRELLRDGIGKSLFLTDEDKAIFSLLHDDLRMIGINVNQIARRLNSGKVVHPGEIEMVLKNVLVGLENVSGEILALKIKRSGGKQLG